MEFYRQEYWSGLPFPSPWDLPDPGIKTASLASPALAGRFFTTSWEDAFNSLLIRIHLRGCEKKDYSTQLDMSMTCTVQVVCVIGSSGSRFSLGDLDYRWLRLMTKVPLIFLQSGLGVREHVRRRE